MKPTTKLAVTVACLALGAAPAVATADRPASPGSQGKDKAATHKPTKARSTHGTTHRTHPASGRSHGRGQAARCRKPTVSKAFVVRGTFTSWTGVEDATASAHPRGSTYSGTISLTIKHANRHARDATSPIAFASARVRFDSPTATAPVAGDAVKLIGKIVVAKRACSTQAASATPAPGTITIRKIRFSTPR